MQLNYTVGSSPAPQNDFQPLAAGTYPGQIVEWAEHTSKSGNQCLKLQVQPGAAPRRCITATGLAGCSQPINALGLGSRGWASSLHPPPAFFSWI